MSFLAMPWKQAGRAYFMVESAARHMQACIISKLDLLKSGMPLKWESRFIQNYPQFSTQLISDYYLYFKILACPLLILKMHLRLLFG